jgi:hypothetical protein
MASAARRARGTARRPFAVLASPSPARNGGAIASAENVAVPFGRRVQWLGKCDGGKAAARRCAATASRRRTRTGSLSARSVTPTTAKARDLSEARGGKVRANLSSPFDEAGRSRHEQRGGSRERATRRSAAMEEAMASLPEPGEGRVKYLVDTFERLLLLAGGGPEATPTTASASTRTPPEAEEIGDVSDRTRCVPPPPRFVVPNCPRS